MKIRVSAQLSVHRLRALSLAGARASHAVRSEYAFARLPVRAEAMVDVRHAGESTSRDGGESTSRGGGESAPPPPPPLPLLMQTARPKVGDGSGRSSSDSWSSLDLFDIDDSSRDTIVRTDRANALDTRPLMAGAFTSTTTATATSANGERDAAAADAAEEDERAANDSATIIRNDSLDWTANSLYLDNKAKKMVRGATARRLRVHARVPLAARFHHAAGGLLCGPREREHGAGAFRVRRGRIRLHRVLEDAKLHKLCFALAGVARAHAALGHTAADAAADAAAAAARERDARERQEDDDQEQARRRARACRRVSAAGARRAGKSGAHVQELHWPPLEPLRLERLRQVSRRGVSRPRARACTRTRMYATTSLPLEHRGYFAIKRAISLIVGDVRPPPQRFLDQTNGAQWRLSFARWPPTVRHL